MTACELFDAPEIEMYFYGELDLAERLRLESHVRACRACRVRLDDLHAIRAALASRPLVDAPPAGDPSAGSGSSRATSSDDWSGFMHRLDAELADARRGALEPSNPRTLKPGNPGTPQPSPLRALLAFAAMLALATLGVVMAMRARPATDMRAAVAAPQPASRAVASSAVASSAVASSAVASSAVASSAVALAAPARPGNRALREGSIEHLERSKLVVLGLATRDPRARVQDWQYERALAGTLLSDTRLYRQAAIQGGATDVAHVMRDLETVLLEASMSDRTDRAALERVQRLIAKRDLLVKMQVMASAGPAGN